MDKASATESSEEVSQAAAQVVQPKRSSRPEQSLVDHQPRATAQRKLQALADGSPRVRHMAQLQRQSESSLQARRIAQFQGQASGRVVQRVDAGAVPVRVNLGDPDTSVRITGLINCVGVVLKIYGNGAQAFDHVSMVGGHFVTPTMYNFGPPAAFAALGNAFIANVQALILGIPAGNIEATFCVKAAAGQGVSQALQEARQAATALRAALGLGGQIEEVAGDVNEAI